MAELIYTQKIIAVLWDFDQTLIPGYQLKPLFEKYKVTPSEFWDENKAALEHERKRNASVDKDTYYLNRILTYVEAGIFGDLNNAKLKELGGKLEFYKGMPRFLRRSKRTIEKENRFKAYDITVEHYIVSSGIRHIIEGSGVDAYVDGIWASEFIEEPLPPYFKPEDITSHTSTVIKQIGYGIGETTKTRAVWEINKGCNKNPSIDVNTQIDLVDRRVPISNMLYVADGPTDVPVFSIINANGGRTLGVYDPGSKDHMKEVKGLQNDGRIQQMGEANYSINTPTSNWIIATLQEIAETIVNNIDITSGKSVEHVIE